jgi:hypothetical protein
MKDVVLRLIDGVVEGATDAGVVETFWVADGVADGMDGAFDISLMTGGEVGSNSAVSELDGYAVVEEGVEIVDVLEGAVVLEGNVSDVISSNSAQKGSPVWSFEER